ncbi:Protein disulfide-isomerase [Capsicum annuum]|nr:Protein disulfide-isomerase [Capsicum annuum]KAF3679290.1 Protein disulfide-isomerase [Capsicum annuum]
MAKRLIPTLNRVLIEKITAPAKTTAGILLPEKSSKLNSGKVVAVGPGLHDKAGNRIPTAVKEGDTVLLPEYGGTQVKLGEKECGHCKKLAPEYEKAASILSSNDPPLVLAKIDASDDANRELAMEYKLQGFPTIKILRDGAKKVQEYNGPREADGIVSYLKKQAGPASNEIKSKEDAATLIDEKKITVVGIFPELSGEKFEKFIALAEKLRAEYDFAHTVDAKLLPRGEPVDKPTIRLLKPFDQLFNDFEDFDVDAAEEFIQAASVPIVTIFDKDPENQVYVSKFFNSLNAKVLLFVNFSTELDAFKLYKDVAIYYKVDGLRFLLGDVEVGTAAFNYFGLKPEQAPLIVIMANEGEKYINTHVKPDAIPSWLKDYKDGKLKPHIKSEPIPEVNDEPVNVVVRDTLQDLVLNSDKNVLLEFYAPWCGHCKALAPILDEVALSLEEDSDVLIAKLDATANDIPTGEFEVKGFPTLYFKSASGNISQYNGDRTKEAIIEFIEENRDEPAAHESESVKVDTTTTPDSAKDEL